ncbi:hemolysin activation/secretion protein [Xenococcus sp. PCC 7305]|nr:hemolysin activation/secretion protein [Xenococcus sp. PCC 7305]
MTLYFGCDNSFILKNNYLFFIVFFLSLVSSIDNNCYAQAGINSEFEHQKANIFLSQANQESLTAPSSTPLNKVDPQASIKIDTITVSGSTIFPQEDFKTIIQPLEGKISSLSELRLVADQITQLYLQDGYITSRAVINSDSLAEGNIQIEIIEGEIEEIKIIGADKLIKYVRSRVNLGAASPLNTRKLEEQLRLLRTDPLIENIEANLSAGSGIGRSTLIVRVKAAKPLALDFGIDNYSPPSVGSERLGLELAYRNLSGLGDTFSTSYFPRIEAFSDTFDLNFQYQVPINPKNGTITAEIELNRNEIVNGIGEDFDINGETELYRLNYRQPIIRSTKQEVALSLGFDYQDSQTFLQEDGFSFIAGPEKGASKTSVLRFGQDYILRQPKGAWAFASSLNLGIDLFDATTNSSESVPDGKFFSWLGQIQRVQVLNKDNFLIIQSEFQLTPDSLLPSQQFIIGGGQSVKGYRQNTRSGDNGFLFSIEDRFTVSRSTAGQPIFTLAPFFNMGAIWNADDNPNERPNQNFLAALGLGFIWQPISDLNIRLDYAPPLIDLDDRGDNVQDDGFHFSVRYSKKI